MKILDDYLKIQKEIFEYFGYEEGWRVLPIDDQRGQHWFLTGEGPGCYVHSPEPFTEESIKEGENVYSGEVYTQRHLPKWVYRGPEYTMVVADTETDDNKLLMIFENRLECKDQQLINTYKRLW
jgi:hypothetical protein